MITAMLGCNSGLAVKLRSERPSLIALHCVCHRLALAAGDAVKICPFTEDLSDFVGSLYALFCRSSKKRDAFEEMAEKYGEGKIKLKRHHRIRWLSRAECLKAAVENINTLVDYVMDNVDSDESIGEGSDEEGG